MHARHFVLLCFLSITLLFTSCGGSCHHNQVIDTIAAARVNVCPKKDVQGPQLTCRRVTEEERKERNLPTSPFILEASNVHPGEEYDLYRLRFNGDLSVIGTYRVDEKLELVPRSGCDLAFDAYMIFPSFMKGEVISFCLLSKNGHAAPVTIAPNPIETSWDDGATVSVTAIEPSMQLFLLTAQKLTPCETIRFISKSWDEVLDNEQKVKDNGTLTMLLAPMVKGKAGGVNRISLERVATQEKVNLEIPYGACAKLKPAIAP